jgi:ABC-2 type transport system permease protein
MITATARVAGGVRRYAQIYRGLLTHDLKHAVQYRWPTVLGIAALMIEPVVYLVVWTSVGDQRGGTVGGLTSDQIAAYYIVWTLVRNLTAGYSPHVWEWRFRDGTLSDLLLRPVHPVHADIAGGFGYNLPRALVALPLTAILIVVFQPELSTSPLTITVFALSLPAAYVLRAIAFCVVGTIGFWTTRIDAAARLYMAAELLLSGRLVPIALMPAWLATLATWLPFRSTFGFPIEVMTTPLSTAEVLGGLAIQLGWIVLMGLMLARLWRLAARRFDAVGI